MGNWVDGNGNLLYGRYKGESLTAIADEDPGYLRRLLCSQMLRVELDAEDTAAIEALVSFEAA